MLKKKILNKLVDELKQLIYRYNKSSELCSQYWKNYYLGQVHSVVNIIRTITKYDCSIIDDRIDNAIKITSINVYKNNKLIVKIKEL